MPKFTRVGTEVKPCLFRLQQTLRGRPRSRFGRQSFHRASRPDACLLPSTKRLSSPCTKNKLSTAKAWELFPLPETAVAASGYHKLHPAKTFFLFLFVQMHIHQPRRRPRRKLLHSIMKQAASGQRKVTDSSPSIPLARTIRLTFGQQQSTTQPRCQLNRRVVSLPAGRPAISQVLLVPLPLLLLLLRRMQKRFLAWEFRGAFA